MNDAPIGIMDSGFGGLTVARAIMDVLPRESIIYIGDTAHGPYGPLSISEVRERALAVMDDLVTRGVKLLVIACNSASAAMLRDARERYTKQQGIPVIEVILPAARRALRTSKNSRIGVIGTKVTIDSQAYEDAFALSEQVDLTMQACPKFVEFVERGVTSGTEVLNAAREYLLPVKDAGVDTVILGCTHYPLLAGAISYVLGPDINLVSSAQETALDVYHTLVNNGLEASGNQPARHELLATGDQAAFERLAQKFLHAAMHEAINSAPQEGAT